jgi:DNA damage-inducible protein 1
MLKAHQACIDLEKNVLRIQGREVRFLSEHELPDKARDSYEPGPDVPPAAEAVGSGSSASQSPQRPSQPSFPGSGNTLGSPPASRSANQGGSRYSESSIQTLMNLGVSREEAARLLDAAGGNVDYAAALLFN